MVEYCCCSSFYSINRSFRRRLMLRVLMNNLKSLTRKRQWPPEEFRMSFFLPRFWQNQTVWSQFRKRLCWFLKIWSKGLLNRMYVTNKLALFGHLWWRFEAGNDKTDIFTSPSRRNAGNFVFESMWKAESYLRIFRNRNLKFAQTSADVEWEHRDISRLVFG